MALTESEELELLELEEAEYQAGKSKPAAPAAEKTSKLESGVRGLGQGASLGLWDELAGLGEGVGQSVGIKGLGSNDWSDIGFTKPLALDENRDFGQAYTEGRDKWRGEDKIAQAENPKSFTTGEVAGGLASTFIPGLNVAKGASVANIAGKSALQSGISAFGNSEADNAADLAMDTAKGAGTGLVVGGTTAGLVNKISPAIENKVLGVAEKSQDASRYLNPPKPAYGASWAPPSGFQMPGFTKGSIPDQVVDKVASFIPGGTMVKNGIEKYGPTAAPSIGKGLDKVTDMLLKSPTMKDLYSKNPQAFNKLATQMAEKLLPEGKIDTNVDGQQGIPVDEPKLYEKEQIIRKTNGTKYAQTIQKAAQRGDRALGAANFVLQSTDPEYRKAVLGEEQN
jgi:hypothetical protein